MSEIKKAVDGWVDKSYHDSEIDGKIKALESQKSTYLREYSQKKWLKYGESGMLILILIISALSYGYYKANLNFISILLVFLAFFLYEAQNSYKTDKAKLHIQTAEVDIKKEIIKKESLQVQISYDLLTNSQNQLDLYYNQNLNQNKILLRFGIILICGSYIFLYYLIYSLFNTNLFNYNDKTFISLIGFATTIVSNLIAGLFIIMYNKSNLSLNKFHEKLVDSNSMYLNNFIISQMKDKGEKNKLISNFVEK